MGEGVHERDEGVPGVVGVDGEVGVVGVLGPVTVGELGTRGRGGVALGWIELLGEILGET